MSLLVIFLSTCLLFGSSLATESIGNREEQASTSGSLPQGVEEDPQLATDSDLDTRQYFGNPNYPYQPDHRPNKRCPLCDSSVYQYCGEKLLHDACCCTDPYTNDLPYQCKLADCRFLHANSCREHRLIANCCCSDDYRAILKSIGTSAP